MIGTGMSLQIETSVLERSAVPAHFPQFRTAAALAHLAHCGKGPPYTLVGGRAWYEIEDIKGWLNANKQQGPAQTADAGSTANRSNSQKPGSKRGRPSKAELYCRRNA